jgi:phytoene desaturase
VAEDSVNPAGPRDSAYDVVIIGAGLGGLSAGACMAKAGKKVLAVDRQDGPGGYAHVFRRESYIFDPAIHITVQGHEEQLLDIYLKILGVRDQVEFVPLAPLYGVDFPDGRFLLPPGAEPYIEAHAERFPAEKEGIRKWVELCMQVTRESQELTARLSLKELQEAARNFPTLFQYRTATSAAAVEDCVTDPRLRTLLTASWPYMGTPPSKLPFILLAAMLASMLDKGSVYCKGSFQTLADALAASLENSGGELLLNTRVSRISIDDGRVAGVELEDGQQIRAPMVVSNADATQTYDELVGSEHLPENFLRRFRRMTPSLSAFVTYSATSLDPSDLDIAHETFVHKQWDNEAIYQEVLEGKPGGMWITIPTLHDPSLAPDGEHIVTFTSLMPYDIGEPWADAAPRYTELLLDEVERLLPGYRDEITFLESATPLTFERITLNRRGAIYGWENILSQNVPKRLGQVSPVDGLFLAGHWTDPGTGSFRVIYSGLQTAMIALGYKSLPDFIGALMEGAPDGAP